MTETVPAAPAPRTWKLVKTPLGDVDLPAAVCDQHTNTTHELAFHQISLAGFDQAVEDARAADHTVIVKEYDTHGPDGSYVEVAFVDVPVGPFYQSARWVDGEFTVCLYSEHYDTLRTQAAAAS